MNQQAVLCLYLLMVTYVSTVPTPRIQWVMYTTTNCTHCERAKADFKLWMIASGWRIGDKKTDHLRIQEIPEDAEEQEEAYPTFVLYNRGKEVKRHVGYPGRERLVSDYLQEAAKK